MLRFFPGGIVTIAVKAHKVTMYNGQGLSNDFHWFSAADDEMKFRVEAKTIPGKYGIEHGQRATGNGESSI